MGGFIFGERGTGKSTYCYKVMAKIYATLNGFDTSDEEEAYKMSLGNMYFDPNHFRKQLILNKVKGEVTPVMTLDDASMHFGNLLHQTDPKLYAALRAATATIRTAVTGFLINAPRRNHVAKCLRDYDDYKGESMGRSGPSTSNEFRQTENWNRKIRFYNWRWYPDEKKFNIRIPFQDFYSCYIPDLFFSWYLKKKNYFEIKYEVDLADKIDPSTRDILVTLKNKLPTYPNQPNLKHIIEQWEKQELEKQKKNKVTELQDVIKKKHLYDKLQMYEKQKL